MALASKEMQATWQVEEATSGKWRRQPLASDGGKWSLQTRGDGGSLIGEGGLICEGSVRVREGEEM